MAPIDVSPAVPTTSTIEEPVKSAALAHEESVQSVEDAAYWTNHSLHIITSLLKSSGLYNDEEQKSHLQFFKETIIPNLGPRPTQPNHAYELVTHNGSPLEFSLNFSTASEAPAVRFSYEPRGSSEHLSEPLGAYMGWFEQLRAEFGPSSEEKKMLSAALPHFPQVPDQLLAVDFKTGGKRAMKAYIGPGIKEMTTGIEPNRASIDAIKNLKPDGERFAPALDVFEEYRASRPTPAKITMLGIDCIEPQAGARIKMYTRTESNAFESIRDQVTLGGRRGDDTTTEGLQILSQIWHLLLNEKEAVAEDFSKPERNPPTMHSGLMISWEFQLDKDLPEPKVYVPLWQFSGSNREISANIENVFKKWGWSWGTEGKYSAAINDAL